MSLLSALTLPIYMLFFSNTLGDPLFYFFVVMMGSISFSDHIYYDIRHSLQGR